VQGNSRQGADAVQDSFSRLSFSRLERRFLVSVSIRLNAFLAAFFAAFTAAFTTVFFSFLAFLLFFDIGRLHVGLCDK
jgi:hypothetical protein